MCACSLCTDFCLADGGYLCLAFDCICVTIAILPLVHVLTSVLASFASSGKVQVKPVFGSFLQAMLLELFLYFQDKSREARFVDYIGFGR